MDLTRTGKLCLSIICGLFFVLLSGACAAPPSDANGTAQMPATSNPVAEADKLYLGRDQDLGRVRSAVIILRGALANDGSNYEAAWRLSKFSYFLGDNTTDETERSRAFTEGVKAGETAVKLQPDKPDGHFWQGANLGGQAKSSPLAGLAAVSKIRAEMNEVIRIDESFADGAAYLALGQIEMQLPAMMGGDPKKAVGYLEKSIKYSDTNVLARYWLARAYIATGRRADAQAKLQEIMKAPADPEYLAEYKRTQAEAQALLDEEFKGR